MPLLFPLTDLLQELIALQPEKSHAGHAGVFLLYRVILLGRQSKPRSDDAVFTFPFHVIGAVIYSKTPLRTTRQQ